MIEIERGRRADQRTGFGNAAHQAKIVPTDLIHGPKMVQIRNKRKVGGFRGAARRRGAGGR